MRASREKKKKSKKKENLSEAREEDLAPSTNLEREISSGKKEQKNRELRRKTGKVFGGELKEGTLLSFSRSAIP